MTYGEIYDRAIWEVIGNDTPPDNTSDMMHGSEGIIGKIQRQIQEDDNYWFMGTNDTVLLVDGTAEYDLDSEFKSEISLRILNESGYYFSQLLRLMPGQLETMQPSDGEARYYYRDFNSSTSVERITLYPTPSIESTQTRTLYIRYYGYLPKLSDVDVTFDATEDRLSIEAPWLVIYKAAGQLAQSIEYTDKFQLCEQRAMIELDRLQKKNYHYGTSNLGKIRYRTV